MPSTPAPRSRVLRSGLATLLVGLGLAAAGFVATPADAKPAEPPVGDHQIAICHADGNGGYSNPNPTKAQVLDIENGHGLHLDDIIPPFAAGSQGATSWPAFAGRNWDTAGRALYDSCSPCKTGTHDELGGCTVPPPPEPEVCPEGQTGTPPDCSDVVVPPEVCPEGQTGTPPDCSDPVVPDPVVPDPVVPDPVVPELITPELAAPALIDPLVVEPERLPVEVEGVQILAAPVQEAVAAAELPRTGANSAGLVRLGVLLVLLGAGAVLLSRERRVAAPVAVPAADTRGLLRTGGWLLVAAAGFLFVGRGHRAR